MRAKLAGTVIGIMVTGIAVMGHAREWDWWQSFQEETRQEERVRAPEPTITDLRATVPESRDTPPEESMQRPIVEIPPTRGASAVPAVPQRVIEIRGSFQPTSILPAAGVAKPEDQDVTSPYDELGGFYILYTDSEDQDTFDQMVLGSAIFLSDAASHMAADPKIEVAALEAGTAGELVNAIYTSNFDMLAADDIMQAMLIEQAMQADALKQMLKNPDAFQEVLKPNKDMFKKVLKGLVDALKKKTGQQQDNAKDPEWDGVGADGTPGSAIPWEGKKKEDKNLAVQSLNAPSCVFKASSPASAGGMGVPKTGGAGGFAGTSTGPEGGGAFGVGKSGQVVKQLGKNIPKDACPQMSKQGQIGKGVPIKLYSEFIPDKWGRRESFTDYVVILCKDKLGVKYTIGMLTGSPERKMNELIQNPGKSDPKAVKEMALAALQQMGKLPPGASPYPTVGKAMDANGIPRQDEKKPPTQDNQGEGKTIKLGTGQPADKPAPKDQATPPPKATNPNPTDVGTNELKADKCDQFKMQMAACFDELTAGQTEKSLSEKSLLCQKMTIYADTNITPDPCGDGKSKAEGFDFYEFMYGNSQGAGAGGGGPDDK